MARQPSHDPGPSISVDGQDGKEPARHRVLMDELLGWLGSGRIRPAVTAHYPLEQATLALRELADRRATGKIVITTALGRAAG
jgi:NADPH:quinone reductase-like Zn-dependent oxidoreductase